MEFVAMPFAIMGFIFGTIAFSHATSASKKIEELEQRLVAAGLLEEEEPAEVESPISRT